MHKILIISYYVDEHEERNKELIYCFEKNLQIGFDSIVVLSEVDLHVLYKNINNDIINSTKSKLYFKKFNSRPSFNDFFKISHLQQFEKNEENLFFIINSDIYFDDLNVVEKFYSEIQDKKNTVLALSRWDILDDGSASLVERIDSQDVWIFYNKIEFLLPEDFSIGIAGCDNALAYQLYKKNYNILNPSDTIKAYHYHLSNIRRYIKKDSIVHKAFIGNEEKRIKGPYYLIDKYEKLKTRKYSKKIISFCLYGNNPKYCIGAIENCKLAKHIYPDWLCRFYISKDVDIKYISELMRHENTEIIIMDKIENHDSMFWRFLPICDDSIDVMISRDCDSRLCMREKYAVDEWMNSQKKFHIMRDHPLHTFKIMGGMFGVKKGCLPNFSGLLKNFTKQNAYNCDQFFLQDIVYPIIKTDCLIHDPFIDLIPFPTERSQEKKFVGEIYDENNSRHPEHYKLITKN